MIKHLADSWEIGENLADSAIPVRGLILTLNWSRHWSKLKAWINQLDSTCSKRIYDTKTLKITWGIFLCCLRKIIAFNQRKKDRDVDRETTRVRENNRASYKSKKNLSYLIPPSLSCICGAWWPASAKNHKDVTETMGNKTPTTRIKPASNKNHDRPCTDMSDQTMNTKPLPKSHGSLDIVQEVLSDRRFAS